MADELNTKTAAGGADVVARVRLLLTGLALVLLVAVGAVVMRFVGPEPIVPLLLVSACVAGYAAQQMMGVAPSASASAATVKAIAAAIDREAMKTGAIRTIDDVSVHAAGAGGRVVQVALTFKDGVSAAHVAPILAKLRAAARADAADITDVVLVSPADDAGAGAGAVGRKESLGTP